MLTLLYPTALWALSTLALPVAIHLWRRPPRTVRLGSLRFLQTHHGRRLHDLRWREWLLLLLRLGVLVLFVCLLTRPVWTPAAPRGPQRWILLDPTCTLEGSSLQHLRTLQAAGYSTHLLAPGLREISDLAVDPTAVAPDLWSFLREADAYLPAGSRLAIFSPDRMTGLRGIRPTLHSKLDWIETSDLAGNAAHLWLEAWHPATSPAEKPISLVGISDAAETRFTSVPPPGWKLDAQANMVRLLGPNGKRTLWTKAQSLTPVNATIFYDADRIEDARYLAAAIRAAIGSTSRKLSLHSFLISTSLEIQPESDRTFWLSATAPPDSIQTRCTQLFQDAPVRTESPPGLIVAQPGTPGATLLTQPIRFWQRGPAITGTVVWTDEHGSPLLTRMPTGRGFRWTFASRFHPDWNDLARTSAFPAWIRALLVPETNFALEHDRRRAAVSQAQPSDATPSAPVTRLLSTNEKSHELHWPIWTLATLLFALERFVCYRRDISPLRPASPMPEMFAAR